jgi:hypothetical protein
MRLTYLRARIYFQHSESAAMHTAEVTFTRRPEAVSITLRIAGQVVAESSSQESIARELQLRQLRFLSIEDIFTTDLPTSERTLKQAAKVGFSEPMAAMKLIAACAAFGEVALFPHPERRGKSRAGGPPKKP